MKKGSTVAVVGLGYVGLPLALLAKEKGMRVIGIDSNAGKIETIQAGHSPIKDARLEADAQKYRIEATTNASRAADAAVVIICVPTPVFKNNEPDLRPLTSALESLRPYLRAGQVLIVESTINPGVMDEIALPLLKQRADLKLDAIDGEAGVVYLAHCPERVNPGDSKWSVRNIPRVIGGYTQTGVSLAKDFYDSVLEAPVMPMGSIKEAEAVKIMENTFRDVNIAFVNEMAKSFNKLGIDITNVIKGASTKPFAFMPHYPGNGVGGHCISVDPYYMIERGRLAGFDHQFLKLARRINDSMPEYTVELMLSGMKKLGLKPEKTTVALLGLAYKKNIDDLRESPALEIRKILEKSHVSLRVFDPYAPKVSNVGNFSEALAGADVIMLATDHKEFIEKLTPSALKAAGVKLVIDGKNSLDAVGIAAVGIPYYGIGRQALARQQDR